MRQPNAFIVLREYKAIAMDAALQGILVIDKPRGMTSMRAVECVRRLLGGPKAGHAGTLDPLASGVLVIAIGRSTKDIPSLMGLEKLYETEIDLSATTNTLDTEGVRQPVELRGPPPTRSEIEEKLVQFRGTFLQAPPAFSAVKINGRRAYDMARNGEDVRPAERNVTVHELSIVGYSWPVLKLSIRCAKGFYVRSLARDLAQSLGLAGHCLSIRRLAVGPYSVQTAMAITDSPQPLRAAIQSMKPLDDSL